MINKAQSSVKLGLMPPLTGLVGIYGSEITRAGRIACDEVNEMGGVLGRPLELVIEDDGSLPESAVAAAMKLVDEHHCAAIIGNLLSNSRISVAYRVAEPRRIPYLNFSFYEGSILSRYFFHFAALPNQQIGRMIPYMLEKYGPRMFFAGNNYEWPRGSIDAAKRALLKSGGAVLGEEYTAIGVTVSDIDALLDKVEAAAPDVFVPYFAGADQINLLTRFTERGLKKKMAVVMGHYDELMASKLPPEVREGFYSSNTYFMTVDNDTNRDYLRRLAAMDGVSGIWPRGNGILTNFGEGAYLCVKAFAQAANAAGNLDPEALVDALNSIRVSGPQGMVQMDPATQHAKVNTYLSRCNADGVFEIIECFGSLPPVMPERYSHQRVENRATLEDDIRLQARMLEQMSEAVMLIESREGKIVYANGGAERMFGYAKGEMLGLPIARLNSPDSGDPVATAAAIVESLNHTGAWKGDIQNIRRDGSTLWCSATVSTFTHPVYGEVWMGVHQNISGQVLAKDQLLRSEERLQRVLDAVNDGVWDWNPVTHEDYLSPRWKAILGYRDEELQNVDSTFFELIHPDDRESVAAAVSRHFEQNEPYRLETRMRHKDGNYRWILTRGEAIRDTSGKPVRMVGTITDINDRKAAEDELRRHRDHLEELVQSRTADLVAARDEAVRANKAKSEFLSRMSHELRTPMNAILGFAQVLELDSLKPEHLEYVHEIHRAGDHLLELINDLLDMARIEAGKMTAVLQPVEVKPLVADAIQIVRSTDDGQRVTMLSQCGETVTVLADPTRLKQVLVNLLSNAAKYNRAGGRVLVGCRSTGNNRMRIAVTDTGPGIAADKVVNLFKPFERLGAENTPVEGVGIGLAFSRQLAELMGGTLGLESTPGEGSTFWIDLPVVGVSSDKQIKAGGDTNGTSLGNKRVLYIEDNPANQRVVAAMLLRMLGLQLLTASDGAHGLAQAQRHQPDVILLDIHLPDIDGYDVLKALQADDATRAIPVVALSADAMPNDIERGHKAGFVEYLTKPVLAGQLAATLEKVLGITRDQREMQAGTARSDGVRK